MNENLRAKITGMLDRFDDELGRQVLDYLEFLESKYNRSRRAPSPVQRITEGLEDRLGSIRIGDVAARGTAQVMEAASRVMAGLAAAGKVVADELEPQEAESAEEAKAGAGEPAAESPPAPPSDSPPKEPSGA